MTEPPTQDTLTAYRLGQVETSLKDMQGNLREAVGTLGGGLTALQTQLTNYQMGLADRYVLRREADQLAKEIEERTQKTEARLNEIVDKDAERGWKVAAAMIGALVSTVLAAIGWLRPPH